MARWNIGRLSIVEAKLVALDADLGRLESLLSSAPPPATLAGAHRTEVQDHHKALKGRLEKEAKESYVGPGDGPNEREAFWLPTIQTVLHQDLAERVDSRDRDRRLRCVFDARCTVDSTLRQVRECLKQRS